MKPVNIIFAHRQDANTWYDDISEADTLDEALDLIKEHTKSESRSYEKIVIELRQGFRVIHGEVVSLAPGGDDGK